MSNQTQDGFVAIYGRFLDGFKLVGPFYSGQDCSEFCENVLDLDECDYEVVSIGCYITEQGRFELETVSDELSGFAIVTGCLIQGFAVSKIFPNRSSAEIEAVEKYGRSSYYRILDVESPNSVERVD